MIAGLRGDNIIAESDYLSLEQRVKALESEIIPVARELPLHAVRALVIDYFEHTPKGENVYPSDIALAYTLDVDMVEKVMDSLVDEGYLNA